MKDPNIGAFAVISLLKYSLIWGSSMAVILATGEDKLVKVVAVSFFVARAVTGITSLTLKHAKKDGMLNMETEKLNGIDLAFLTIQFFGGSVLMVMIDTVAGAFAFVGITAFTFYYRHLTYKEFGGVTGDTAGYYLVMAECVGLMMTAISVFIR